MKKNHIGLIRHAPTGWNTAKRIQGQHDVSLPQSSFEEIEKWIPQLKKYPWTRIVTSDLSRAYLTALKINKHLDIPIELDDRLREQDWGLWTGDSIKDIRKKDPEQITYQESTGWNFTPPLGESRNAVLTRTLSAIHEATKRWPGEDILFVTHYGNIATIANHLLDKKFLPEEGKLVDKRALHRVKVDNSHPQGTKYSLIALNEKL
ncbi:MAG: histidine phosphatase family protein [Desulfovibrionales bacterium]|nr:histidine phosphatase family protein [Desulfovibrionales bacterium]